MRVVSVNVGRVRPLRVGDRTLTSGIGKAPVSGPVGVGPLGLQGDEQADLSVHGGLLKAVYAYPVEHLPFWSGQRGLHGAGLFDEPVAPGFMGENLSIEGLLEDRVWIGDALHFPDCVLRVTAPREPCGKFCAVMGLSSAGKLMMQQGCPGFYLAVERAGTISASQTFEVVAGGRGLSVRDAFVAKRFKHLR